MNSLPRLSEYKVTDHNFITHCPRLHKIIESQKVDVSVCEKLLKEWFGCEVILMASGRSGIHVFLQTEGYHRYKHKFEVPLYLSRCVINALTSSVFPAEFPVIGDGILFYHQFGFPQRWKPNSTAVVLEDIAHSFYANQYSGKRLWHGKVAAFSLPKFFAMNGLVGGLVVPDRTTADKIRVFIEKTSIDSEDTRKWTRDVLFDFYKSNDESNFLIDSAFEILLKMLRPDPINICGFPESISEIMTIGENRKERCDFFRTFFKGRAFPKDFWETEENFLPFALPYFGSGILKNLKNINSALEERNVKAGIYHVDVNRNSRDTDFKPCVLLPSHQDISMEKYESICRIVLDNDK